MIKFATDEDFNNRILRGLLRRHPDLDMVRIQDTHLSGAVDAAVLEWAFSQGDKVLFLPDQHLGRNTAYGLGFRLEEMTVWDQDHPAPQDELPTMLVVDADTGTVLQGGGNG